MRLAVPLSAARTAAALSLLTTLFSACGGKSAASDEGGSGVHTGTGATASGSGGSASVASGGQVGSAGIAPGGFTNGGATNGGATSAGAASGGFTTGGVAHGGAAATAGAAGSYGGEGCSAPFDSGPCDAAIPVWYHDPSTGICRPSSYGGCQGNANRYATLAECQKACSAGTPNNDSCQRSGDCVLDGTTCCGLCDSEGLTLQSFIAYNPALGSGCSGSGAPAPLGGSGNTARPAGGACAPCPMLAPDTGTRRYFFAECVAGQCSVTDARTSPATACQTSSDCRLRHGTSCCETCDAQLFAVATNGSFEQLACGGALPPCPACPPEPTTAATATCVDGRCVVSNPGASTP
jgi:hypothetical protein